MTIYVLQLLKSLWKYSLTVEIRTPLTLLHNKLREIALFTRDHTACKVCSTDLRGCQKVKDDIQRLLNQGELVVEKKCDDVCAATSEEPVEIFFDSRKSVDAPLVICLPGPIPYTSEKAIPYKYNATIIEDGREVPIPPLPYVVNITKDSRVLRNARVIPALFQKKAGAPVIEQIQAKDSNTTKDAGQTSRTNTNADFEELLQLIKNSEYKVIDQLMQTPSKKFILSLFLNSEAHRNAWMKVLNQAFVNHDITIGKFDGVVGNITACNNLSFSDEELPEEGRNHNMALHISV